MRRRIGALSSSDAVAPKAAASSRSFGWGPGNRRHLRIRVDELIAHASECEAGTSVLVSMLNGGGFSGTFRALESASRAIILEEAHAVHDPLMLYDSLSIPVREVASLRSDCML